MPPSSYLSTRSIAGVRIATGIIFLFFGEYKIVGPAFVHGGFEQWIHQFVDQDMAVGIYKVFLVKFVLMHPVLCARIVGWGEFAIGLSLVLGIVVRAASVAGTIHMISLALATGYAPGHGAPMWRYFGANLDHIPLLFLFVIFYTSRAGDVWGFDDRRRMPRKKL